MDLGCVIQSMVAEDGPRRKALDNGLRRDDGFERRQLKNRHSGAGRNPSSINLRRNSR
jgi:hypothetical protein